MKTYAFYLSDIAVNVYDKKTLTAEKTKQLKAEGFHKMPFEAKAENEALATDLMFMHFKENHESLKEFTTDYCISSTIFASLYMLNA